jgi:hypothetical protein
VVPESLTRQTRASTSLSTSVFREFQSTALLDTIGWNGGLHSSALELERGSYPSHQQSRESQRPGPAATTNRKLQPATRNVLSILTLRSVANPNWFDADFKKVSAEVKYNGGQFGGGQINNVNFQAYRVSTFDFPFNLK